MTLLALAQSIQYSLLGMLFAFSLPAALLSAAGVYAAARKAEHDDPGRLAQIVAVSYMGTMLVGLPVFLVVMFRLRPKIERLEKERERRNGE
ncbi:hypothetical protein [Haloprofundus halobius]|uniref:hypothetical protein n=1 Tax=Haloprofundus halobius TaxID=2876194 RepID=UPI001CC98A1A|nr:hypothetical protein [Haloprofundus halobius]